MAQVTMAHRIPRLLPPEDFFVDRTGKKGYKSLPPIGFHQDGGHNSAA